MASQKYAAEVMTLARPAHQPLPSSHAGDITTTAAGTPSTLSVPPGRRNAPAPEQSWCISYNNPLSIYSSTTLRYVMLSRLYWKLSWWRTLSYRSFLNAKFLNNYGGANNLYKKLFLSFVDVALMRFFTCMKSVNNSLETASLPNRAAFTPINNIF